MNDFKKFSINEIENFDDENLEFAVGRIGFLASGDNAQHCPISDQVLKRDAHTALGKPIVAKFDDYAGDVTSHVEDEVIVGWIPADSAIDFVTMDDGRIMAYADCVLSKIYAIDVYNLFKEKNYRSVSSEFTCKQDNPKEDGSGEVTEFNVTGITILGTQYGLPVRPAVEGANIQVKKFSLDNANKLFDEYNNPLKKFADDRRKLMEKEGSKNFPVDTSKDAVDMGDWNGDKAKHDLMDSKNYDSIGDKVCLDFTKGDKKLENCKYPVMNVKDGKWVYNAEGLSSAMAYAAQHDPEVYKKAVSLQKKLGLYKDDKKEDSKKMSEEKKFEIEGREAWGDVIKEVQDHEGKDAYVESVEKDHIIYKIGKDGDRMTVKADVKVGKDDKKVSAKIDWDTKKKDADQKEFADDETKKDEKEMSCGEGEKEMSSNKEEDGEIVMGKDNKEKDDKEKDNKEKKFSLDSFLDFDAMLATMADETEATKDFVKDFCKMSAEDMVKCACDLKKFKDEKVFAEKKEKVDAIMASVKGDIPDKDFADLQEEGKSCSADKVEAFENKVKAFAYEFSKKNKPSNGFMTFANDVRVEGSQSIDDLYNKYR